MKKTICIIAAILYSSVTATAYFLSSDMLLFFLTVPWSLIVAALSPVLFHGFGPSASLNLLALGGVLNVLVFCRLTLISTGPDDSE